MDRKRLTGLDAFYGDVHGECFMTGIQALVRLPLMQRRLDRANGHNTAGLISGYRGSPLGAYDQQLWKASRWLKADDIVFQPGLNEDLAATALWGAQMHKAYGPTKVDGVFGLWYGKGPGVDRSGDAFRAANVLGTSALGGVLAVAGDDHAAQSSMYPHQTDGIFQSVMTPVLQPASVSEILSLGLAGFALSRFSGLWVGMKTIAEVVESAATFIMPPAQNFIAPAEAVPPHGLNWDPTIAWPAERAELERRLLDERLPAALAWARANRLDHPVIETVRKRVCFVTVGKAHQDLMQAFDDLGLSAADVSALGGAVYKVAMSWPLDTQSLLAFADGFEEIVVVEEKQPIVEDQIKTALYHAPADRRPRITGKHAPTGEDRLPAALEFTPLMVARCVVEAFAATEAGERLQSRLSVLEARADRSKVIPFPARKPFFCSGCPHNTSTRAPDGSIAGGGIGCHVMALSQPALKTTTFSQMGGEGAQWIGAAPFSKTEHVFQNLGDGTYQHSGLLAIRAAVAAKAPITYKILYNDAVAMTGGQPAEGSLSPGAISRQLAAEGVVEIHLVSDDPEKWATLSSDLAHGVKIHHRDDLNEVQKALRTVPGVTAIIYEQTCAAEKRRRRKRKEAPDPDRRLFINSRVCEGCGDCSVQSNCIAVEPLETEFGRKRQINQSSCNKDFSCVKGFCPSFVEIDGPALRKPDAKRLIDLEARLFADLPAPQIPGPGAAYNVYIAGIGGLGVLTLGALLGMAAHIDGLQSSVLDFTGLAQKNGAVVSQVRIAPADGAIHAVRIGAGDVDLLLATDALVAAGPDGLTKMADGRTAVVLNSDETPTADAVVDRDHRLPTERIVKTLLGRAGPHAHALRANALARGLFGDTVAANVMILGFAWQKGLVPVSLEALQGAIEANGAAVKANLRALSWGRMAAVDMARAEEVAQIAPPPPVALALPQLLARRRAELVGYQDEAYARRFDALITKAAQAAAGFGDGGERFVRAVAENGYKLMAYKDEYEVARLYAAPEFKAGLAAQFSDMKRMSVWLAPPLLSRVDPRTGRPAKRKFGPWVFTAFAILARLKRLRGTWADPFGRTKERRTERALITEYVDRIGYLSANLTAQRLEAAIALAQLPADIRGFGPVKEAAIVKAKARGDQLLAAFDAADAAAPNANAA